MIASALGSRNNTLGNTFPEHLSEGTPTPLDTASTASIGQHSTSTVLTEKQPGPSNSQAKLPGQGRLTPLPVVLLQIRNCFYKFSLLLAKELSGHTMFLLYFLWMKQIDVTTKNSINILVSHFLGIGKHSFHLLVAAQIYSRFQKLTCKNFISAH